MYENEGIRYRKSQFIHRALEDIIVHSFHLMACIDHLNHHIIIMSSAIHVY